MSVERFDHLYRGLSGILGFPAAPLAGGPDISQQAFHVKRHGVMANVLYFASCPDHVFVLADFGPIPHDHPRLAQIVLALLDVNFLVPNPHAPAVGRNPVTGSVTLRSMVALETATPESLLELVDQSAQLALAWRKDFFLADVPLATDVPSGALTV